MAKINLDYGYFVETDPLNYALKLEYLGKSKTDNQLKKMVKLIGYYENMTRAVEEYINHYSRHIADSFDGSIKEYAELIDDVGRKAINELVRKGINLEDM